MEINLAYHTFFSFALSILFLTVSLSGFSLFKAESLSFTAELIHRDSPNSPFFNASETLASRLDNAVQRSADRFDRFSSLISNSITASEFPSVISNGDFLMKISIGTPPTQLLVNVATGSDLVWIPCLSSRACGQNCDLRFFDPTISSTYKNVPCDSYQCQITSGASCQFSNCFYSCGPRHQDSCPDGALATDTLTLNSTTGQPFMLPDTDFICGNLIAGDYPGVGILGLGHGSLSLLNRIGHLIDGKFSHCIVPYSSNQTSKISFGEKAVVSGNEVILTPLVMNGGPHSYTLSLYGISVGNDFIDMRGMGGDYYMNGLGIDSGTMFTYLPDYLYNDLQYKVIGAIQQEPLYTDPTRKLNLCYKYSPDFNPPTITMHFDGGDVELSSYNSFIRMSEDMVCLAFAPSTIEHDALYGYWQQTNFLIGYDLDAGVLSFKKTDCTKY